MSESILTFIQNHAAWAGVIVFVIAFLESVAILGLLVPGWLILVGVGSLIGADLLPFYPIVFSAYLGAVIGEYLSFLLGYHYHEKILTWPIMKRHDKLIANSRAFFLRHGVSGVFFGRFFGPTRAVVPLIAGIAEMKPKTFIWVNFVSGLIWAPLYLIPGILVGAAFALEQEAGYSLVFVLTLITAAMTASWNYWRKYWQAKRKNTGEKRALTHAVLMASISLSTLVIFVQSPYWALMKEILKVLWSKL